MVLIVGAALAALLRGLMTPETAYQNARNLIRIARAGGAGSQLAKAAVQGYLRGGVDEVERVFARTATQLEGQMAPLLRSFEMGANNPFNVRAYGTADEGFQAAVNAERVASMEEILSTLNPYVAAIAAGTAAVGVFEAEHHRHGVMHDMHHPIDAITDVAHSMEGVVERFIHKFEDAFSGNKRKTPEPDSPPGVLDDFSGIQYTFYNPPTGRIINYKGIRRFGRHFSKQSTGKHAGFGRYDLDSARPVSRIRPE